MFRPAFTAVCDGCGTTTMWVKANRMAHEDGRSRVLKGFRCTDCDAFEAKVLDTRGRIRTREDPASSPKR